MTPLQELLPLLGALWTAALVAELLAVLAESWGSMKRKDGEEELTGRKGGAAIAMAIITTASPALLLAHAFAATAQAQSLDLILWSFGIVFLTMMLGALAGWALGAMARGAAKAMHFIALPLGLIAVGLAFAAAWPGFPWLIEAVANRFG